MNEDEQAVYDYLRTVAERGEQMPPNNIIGVESDTGSISQVTKIIRGMKKAGVIAVEILPNWQRRVIFPDGVKSDWSDNGIKRRSKTLPPPAEKTDEDFLEQIIEVRERRGLPGVVTIGPNGIESNIAVTYKVGRK